MGSTSLPQRFCSNHPQRAAIGVCVVTSTPICSECSTRYEGVNYSKEGLRLLRERRAAAAKGTRSGATTLLIIVAWCTAPLQLYLVYQSYAMSAELLAQLLHWKP
ncbi:MAG TPA: hypothetical protein VGN72_17320 [Tepidisphaeraceae bacterium]|nr:hypothetical protein [Tepidisphaeraceae bacterium]